MNPSPSTKVELIELISSVNWDNLLIPVQKDATLLANNSLRWMLHVAPFVHPVACCCMWLRDVGSCWAKFETGQTFELTTPKISLLPWSPKRSATMFDRFAQLFQPCWGYARALTWFYKVLWVTSFPRCTAGPNIVGSSCIRLPIFIQDLPLQQGWYQRGSWWMTEKKFKTWEYNQTWNDRQWKYVLYSNITG